MLKVKLGTAKKADALVASQTNDAPAASKPKRSRKSAAAPTTQKVVINTRYGCFGVSKKAFERLVDLENKHALAWKRKIEAAPKQFKDDTSFCHDMPRNDPDLVRLVERMGENADGAYAQLKIVEIPASVEWTVVEYDGREHIEEKHRVWE